MNSDQYYFRPKCDERTYELAVERASYLIDNGYVKLTSGLTEEQLIDNIVRMLLKQKKDDINS